MTNSKTWFRLTPILILILSLFFASPTHAHSGEGDHLHGPAARWMLELIYIQILIMPIVGIWLTKEVFAAWWPGRGAKGIGRN